LNQLAPIVYALPAVAIEPHFTGPLEHAISTHTEPGWNGEYKRLALHPGARHEAENGRKVLASMCQPIDRQQLIAWLYPLVAASRIVPSDEDFMAKASVIAIAVSDFPRACFTAETQREALRMPEPSERQAMTQAARDAIIAEFHPKFEAVMAEARQPEVAAATHRALPMSDAALLATYERLAKDGNAAAVIRCDMLRKKIARENEYFGGNRP
jgi:hypothetical protein